MTDEEFQESISAVTLVSQTALGVHQSLQILTLALIISPFESMAEVPDEKRGEFLANFGAITGSVLRAAIIHGGPVEKLCTSDGKDWPVMGDGPCDCSECVEGRKRMNG